MSPVVCQEEQLVATRNAVLVNFRRRKTHAERRGPPPNLRDVGSQLILTNGPRAEHERDVSRDESSTRGLVGATERINSLTGPNHPIWTEIHDRRANRRVRSMTEAA